MCVVCDRYGARLPHFPSHTLESVAAGMAAFPRQSAATLLTRVYPHELLQPETAGVEVGSLQETVSMALEKFSLGTPGTEM